MTSKQRVECITLPDNSVVVTGSVFDYLAGLERENERLKAGGELARHALNEALAGRLTAGEAAPTSNDCGAGARCCHTAALLDQREAEIVNLRAELSCAKGEIERLRAENESIRADRLDEVNNSYKDGRDDERRARETGGNQAPIAKLTIGEDGMVQRTGLYAPGLPPGDHELYCTPLKTKEVTEPDYTFEHLLSKLICTGREFASGPKLREAIEAVLAHHYGEPYKSMLEQRRAEKATASIDIPKLQTDLEVLQASVDRVCTVEVRDVLRLLADGEISVGKAHEWIREFVRDGKRGSLPDIGSEKTNESKPRENGPRGSWICGACKGDNFPEDDVCVHCGEGNKPVDVSAARTFYKGNKAKDEPCAHCGRVWDMHLGNMQCLSDPRNGGA